jgi:glycosyltransferase involved in cell wall biosynthesis
LKSKPKILLVTGYWKENSQSCCQSSFKLLNILACLSSSLTWIVTNQSLGKYTPIDTCSVIPVKCRFAEGFHFKSFYYKILHQVKITISLVRLINSSKINIVMFAFGSDTLIIPIIISRILGKKVILRSDGRPSYVLRMYYEEKNKIKILPFYMVETLNYRLATKLVLECKYMIHLYNLEKYANKLGLGNLYVDTLTFRPTKSFSERKYEIGYIGNFVKEKGVIEFVRSLRLLRPKGDFNVVMVGEGPLKDEAQQLAFSSGIQANISGWVDQKEVSNYLKDIKLLVVPSSKEGLPNIVLEAMACGTLVLATPIGGIPDVIKDGETGFIMEDNSPECISANVTRALAHANKAEIINNALTLIHGEYDYPAAAKRFEDLLSEIQDK